jgi:hypothetical protein
VWAAPSKVVGNWVQVRLERVARFPNLDCHPFKKR